MGRATVYDYFRRAYRGVAQRRARPRGPLLRAPDGSCAAFDVEIAGGRIAGIQYNCTTCVTLVALCEHLAELVAGATVEEARRLEPERLLELHPEIPPARHHHAALALEAFQAALRMNQ